MTNNYIFLFYFFHYVQYIKSQSRKKGILNIVLISSFIIIQSKIPLFSLGKTKVYYKNDDHIHIFHIRTNIVIVYMYTKYEHYVVFFK